MPCPGISPVTSAGINQALLKNFDAIIGTGTAWPATTSLAAHLLNVHMGRLLEAHRTTSRSNDALYLEGVALQSGAMFNYLENGAGDGALRWQRHCAL